MKLLILSDLHLEHGVSLTVPLGLEYDAVILAGDISSPGHKAVHWAQRESTFAGKPVLLVPGNHEYYGTKMATELRLMREAAEGSNVHVLSRDAVDIDGFHFVGTTLWTDFQCPIRNDDGEEIDIERAWTAAQRFVVDYRAIEIESGARSNYRERQFKRLLTPQDTLALHWLERDWLRRELTKPPELPTVVVTHHGPSRGSIAEKFAGDWVTGAFVSDLPPAFFERPRLWVHGHTHTSFDYQVGQCRIVCNPRGYRLRDGTWENPSFTPLVVEV